MSEIATRRRIRAQRSPRDPATMRFILDAPVQEGRSASFDDPSDEAPLALALFAIDGVSKVQVADETVVVTRAPDADWEVLKAPIAAAIREVLDSSARPLGELTEASSADQSDEALLTAVERLLDTQVNPSIASHGGHISAEKVENGNVHLRMSGGCQGCAASAVTLRQGVETMLRSAQPAIREIIDVTDHASGETPFYQRDSGQSPAFNRPVPASVIAWEDGELVIDPDYLASRLGLAVDDLQAGLSRGEIVIESSPETPSEVTRVTVRGGQRAWAADIKSDGTAQEIPPPRPSPVAKAASLPDRVRAYLANLPADDLPITYGRLARGLAMYAPGSIRKVTGALETTMREDFAADRPFIAARVVGRGSASLPGQGFFELAQTLGSGPQQGETEHGFHQRHLSESLKAD